MKTKLRLNRETLRRLTPEELQAAQGGYSAGPTNCGGCGTNTCATCLKTGCVPPEEGTVVV
jgi:hypothetical protein